MQLKIQSNQKEIKDHGDYSFPLRISEEAIHRFDTDSFLWHWHPEIELTWIMDGTMDYSVNEKHYILKQGDGLFVNSNVMHSGYMIDHQSCNYLSITFHPRYIYGYENSILQTKYVDSIISNPHWSSLVLHPDIDWQGEIVEKIKEIYHLSRNQTDDYELNVHLTLGRIWQLLFLHYTQLPEKPQTADTHTQRLKDILFYIQEHYQGPVTLEEIASSVSFCKSECCRFFKKHMGMTLFEYLLFFRIQQSLPLLRLDESITKIAATVGFSDPSYYGKIFKRYMNCSPGQYRKHHGRL